MNMNIKGLQIDLTDAIKGYVQTRIASLEKFVKDGAYAYIQVGKPSKHHKGGQHEFLAEISLDTHGHTYFIEMTDADLYTAIDNAVEEIINQVKQGKGKRQTALRRGHMMLKNLTRKGFYGWNK